MSERLNQHEGHLSTLQKLKIAAGVGIVAAGAAFETFGIVEGRADIRTGGFALLTAGAILTLRQIPETSRFFRGR